MEFAIENAQTLKKRGMRGTFQKRPVVEAAAEEAVAEPAAAVLAPKRAEEAAAATAQAQPL